MNRLRSGGRGGKIPCAVVLVVASVLCIIHCKSDGAGTSGGTTATSVVHAKPHRINHLWTTIRRTINLANTVGSPLHSQTPYDRIIGCPVFAVTTPWGSPYMSMERMTGDRDETVPVNEYDDSSVDNNNNNKSKDNVKSFSEESSEVRMIGLYFTDEDDAVAMQCEMKQLDNLKEADIRVSAFSLAKAIRQASVLGGGLTTGAPVDDTTGRLAGTDAGGRLRYKLVPSKRQLYYAARCVGKERVGLCSDTASADARLVVAGNTAIESANLQRRTVKRDAKRLQAASATIAQTSSKITATAGRGNGNTKNSSSNSSSSSNNAIKNNPMAGYSGIPVFTCAAMQKRKWGRTEQPFFMNYEDLNEAWNKCRGRPLSSDHDTTTVSTSSSTPPPPVVEVFNLMDVLTSMDRAGVGRGSTKDKNNDSMLLHRITFVPSSRSVAFKERITTTGNGKARLRPMR